ncbi:VOC family protein [Thalassobacillus pellis]|uniref:VOC family protein n=1 Tax=Thalassobacillus pellis TaxID=748008 RepID=UPI0019619994|nr:VOC family protein [Thalassobacillus pellis]
MKTAGIHHITAIVKDPQHNIDFYENVLGLRLVKKTVNFDDPGVYHLYFGDYFGNPGTIMTFFPITQAVKGKAGTGQVDRIVFAVPNGSMPFWKDHLHKNNVEIDIYKEDLLFEDPEGVKLAVSEIDYPTEDRHASILPKQHNILGIKGAVLDSRSPGSTIDVLTKMGYQVQMKNDDVTLLVTESSSVGSFIWVKNESGKPAKSGAGTVHHIAFRTKNEAEQEKWQQYLITLGLRVTPVMDRDYFKSVYFHEFGGILFEIATDPPGFTADEALEELGNRLKLPAWLEPKRPMIEKLLPDITRR